MPVEESKREAAVTKGISMIEHGMEKPTPFMEFSLDYDPYTLKATEYKICSCARPHMRAFHLAWTSFLMAFIAWFSFAPLGPAIKKTLGLKKSDILWANISSVLSTVFARFAIGPIMDHVGPRLGQAFLLIFAAIPTYFAGLIQNVAGLCIIRGLVGVVGATFVGCQFWCTLMFEKELAGTMNAIAGGWGNLGGGLTQAIMVGIYAMNTSHPDCDAECGWRNAFYIPATCLLVSAMCVLMFGDDCPFGAYQPPVHHENPDEKANVMKVAGNFQVWVLVVQYAVCFGMELHVNNTIALYYFDRFGLTLTTAGLIASLFGLMNLFARAWGGMISDFAYNRYGMAGRKYAHIIITCGEGIFLVIFSRMPNLGSAIFMMIIFSLFVQSAEGSTFGIVPYVDPKNTGAVCGFVGAGGNIGAVCWGFLFLGVGNFADGYMILGFIVFAIGLTGICTIFVEDTSHRKGGSTVMDKSLEGMDASLEGKSSAIELNKA
uniref:Nitrate/nitrite transporter n=1 Tax=Lotharella globosa TaxID=91324 RepID=A0A7S3Z2S8_9EUKA|mmetsp:Transcript_9926/g.19581  ORF Transcript_9926/g.19581 Transcript_9926/m.19581 type:complete len:489 (-) Transcript_9926:270-1736(-)